ncbi:MAG: alginate lyase family protein, partial [Verrucomicrobia bacterium]|nr:alginate lyase family protein [Verrucomicrobiota bacterium]
MNNILRRMPLTVLILSSFASPCFAGNFIQTDADRAGDGYPAAWPRINGSAINPESYKLMQEHGFLPLKTAYLSDEEVAQKFDLSLPQMGAVKEAVDKKDAAALKTALIAYLNGKLRPLKPAHPPKPIPYANSSNPQQRPDTWLGNFITIDFNGQKKTYPLQERINWYYIDDGEPDMQGWCWWGNPLAEAWLASGDPKYAEALLKYVRLFYKNCRPPAQKETHYSGALGPWSVGGRGRCTGFVQWLYTVVANAPATTDEDRLMFLKLIYEHGECMYGLAEIHHISNFEFYPITVLSLLSHQFPEFKESSAWQERAKDLLLRNMEDSVLDDGGQQERTQYSFGYAQSYTRLLRQLTPEGAPLPEKLLRIIESMYDFNLWILSPLHQWPNFNIGGMQDLLNCMVPGSELFPERADFLYLATHGAKGRPPVKTARVMAHSGFATMRGDWTTNALFMAMNYCGSLPEDSNCGYRQLLSFSIWAHGRAYLTNPGNCLNYSDPLFGAWMASTQAANTVMVDQQEQQLISNGGRLQSWSDHSGFTYLATETQNYRHLGVLHRRAVFFLKQSYWVVFDRMTPIGPAGKVHDYRWQAHFQPMEITVDDKTRTAASSLVDGKRCYVAPADPEKQEVERGEGFIADGVHDTASALKGPFVRYIQKSDKPVSFTVLLCPTKNNAPAPTLSTLAVADGNATGVQIRQGDKEDTIAMAECAGLRVYGPLTTDGEAAYVRKEGGKIVEAGLVGGQKLIYSGKTLIEVGPEIASADIHYA